MNWTVVFVVAYTIETIKYTTEIRCKTPGILTEAKSSKPPKHNSIIKANSPTAMYNCFLRSYSPNNKTVMIAVKSKRTSIREMPSSEPKWIFEKKLSDNPKRNILNARVIIFSKTDLSNFITGIESTVEIPTMNKKNGKTKSVGVQPFHSACSSGA